MCRFHNWRLPTPGTDRTNRDPVAVVLGFQIRATLSPAQPFPASFWAEPEIQKTTRELRPTRQCSHKGGRLEELVPKPVFLGGDLAEGVFVAAVPS